MREVTRASGEVMRLSCEVIRESCEVTRESCGAFIFTFQRRVLRPITASVFLKCGCVSWFSDRPHRDLIGKDSQADQQFERAAPKGPRHGTFLIAMDGIVGRIQVQNDLAKPARGTQENIDHQAVDRHTFAKLCELAANQVRP